MEMTKGSMPKSKSGGMKGHMGSNPDNMPGKSKACNNGFSGKNMPKGSTSGRHQTASKESGV